ncbi:hypothetical protein [Deinococcus sp. Arct2-2]|uniref:hypothetical protein n=1 Tax=Deinococcus sp. Arct2-2 TaxID=2568653 RepID=UPI001F10F52B|nr:hypothetical protein [Deinococcus sp. Arct2-2]
MLWAGFLWGKTSGTHEFIGAAQIHLFAKLLFNPLLKPLAFPHDTLLNICVQLSCKHLLLISGQDAWRTPIVPPSILQALQTQAVVSVNHVASRAHPICGDVHDITFTSTFRQQREELRPSSLHRTSTRAVNRPELVSLMLKLNRRIELVDSPSLASLFGVRIIGFEKGNKQVGAKAYVFAPFEFSFLFDARINQHWDN